MTKQFKKKTQRNTSWSESDLTKPESQLNDCENECSTSKWPPYSGCGGILQFLGIMNSRIALATSWIPGQPQLQSKTLLSKQASKKESIKEKKKLASMFSTKTPMFNNNCAYF